MIGSSLPHFRITDKLGEGGMGEVYQAMDTRLDRKVALKILPEDVAGDPDRRGRFEAEALAASAEIKYLFEYDWEGADEDLRRAIEINPGSDFAHEAYGSYLAAVGRFDEAIEQGTLAKELDPLSPSVFHLVAFALMGQHEYDRAAEEFQAALDVDPVVYGIVYAAMGDADRLLEALGRSIDDHSTLAVYTPVVPTYYMPGLEDDPRYLELMDRLGFPTTSLVVGGVG